jgi:hypothetical protein
MPALTVLLAGAALFAQKPTIYQQVVRTPDIRNGYEDYLRAADAVHTPAIDALLRWSPQGEPEESSRGATQEEIERVRISNQILNWRLLRVRREIAEQGARALQLMKVGNAKPVYDPREKRTPETAYPELSEFKVLMRVLAADAYVKYADGNSAAGTQQLLDGLVFANKVSGGSLISSLVGIASTAIVLGSFETHLRRLSLNDCKKIQAAVGSILTEPSHMLRALKFERDSASDAFAYRISNPDAGIAFGRADDAERVQTIRSLPESAKAQLRDRFLKASMAIHALVEEAVRRPESEWGRVDDQIQKLIGGATDPPTKILLEASTPHFGLALTEYAKQRTQLRLLDLHARIIEFRWIHGRLPNTLAEAVGSERSRDPLSGDLFQYELRLGNSYRLYSKGTKELGEIELRYQAPLAEGANTRDPNLPPQACVGGGDR